MYALSQAEEGRIAFCLFVCCFCGLNLMPFEAVNKDLPPFLQSASTELCSPVDVIADIHGDK